MITLTQFSSRFKCVKLNWTLAQYFENFVISCQKIFEVINTFPEIWKFYSSELRARNKNSIFQEILRINNFLKLNLLNNII